MTALTAEIAFAAEMPANVQNVSANVQNGELTVSWTPVLGAAFYRVYFSHESIIGNEGNYDDFERTLAGETVHTFTKMPLGSPKIFLGVLAVDAGGNESEGFETETSVDQPAPEAPAAPAPQTQDPQVLDPLAASGQPDAMPQGVNPTTTAEPMNMTAVGAVSQTGVLVMFTKNVSIDAPIDPAFFLVTDSGGTALAIHHVTVSAGTILLATDPQVPGRNYTFGLLQPIPSGDGTNASPATPPMQFPGFGTPEQPQDQGQPQMPQDQPAIPYGQNPMLGGPPPQAQQQGGYGQNPMLGNVMDPNFLDINATPRKDGTYDIVARWNGAPNAQNYGLYTAVNGQAYAWSGQVGPQETSVQYSRVKPGSFALRVTSRTGQGQESRGIERAINLPDTGLGLIGVLAAAGAAAGIRMRRRKQAV